MNLENEKLTPTAELPGIFIRPHWRAIAVLFSSLLVATFLLVYFGGFDKVGKFFGVGASTVQTITLAGRQNLAGEDYTGKPAWLVSGSSAIESGVGIFDSFSGVPDANLTVQPGVVLPLVSSLEANQNTIQSHTYISPLINLGGTETTIKTIKILTYEGENSQMTFGYRTGTDESSTSFAHFTPLETIAEPYAGSDKIMARTVNLEAPASRYLQFRVEFTDLDAHLGKRPAVYAFMVDFTGGVGEHALVPDVQVANVTEPIDRAISIHYADDQTVPTKADIKVYSAEDPSKTIYSMQDIDLAQRLSYTFNVKLADGAYAALLTAPGFEPKVVVFELKGGATDVAVDAGSFEKSKLDIFHQADLNGDGAVNSIDVNLLLEQFGTPPATETTP